MKQPKSSRRSPKRGLNLTRPVISPNGIVYSEPPRNHTTKLEHNDWLFTDDDYQHLNRLTKLFRVFYE
jgi:hypothetical protein